MGRDITWLHQQWLSIYAKNYYVKLKPLSIYQTAKTNKQNYGIKSKLLLDYYFLHQSIIYNSI